MCAGIRDAANLAWKLAAVVGGQDEGLLDSYATERAPHVRACIELAIRVGGLINEGHGGRRAARRAGRRSTVPRLGDLGAALEPAASGQIRAAA